MHTLATTRGGGAHGKHCPLLSTGAAKINTELKFPVVALTLNNKVNTGVSQNIKQCINNYIMTWTTKKCGDLDP